jgi:hypothetical protein
VILRDSSRSFYPVYSLVPVRFQQKSARLNGPRIIYLPQHKIPCQEVTLLNGSRHVELSSRYHPFKLDQDTATKSNSVPHGFAILAGNRDEHL